MSIQKKTHTYELSESGCSERDFNKEKMFVTC